MNLNAQKLAALVNKGDKRVKRLQERDNPARVPLTTIKDNARGTIPTLRHAMAYKKALKLRFEDWFAEVMPLEVPR